MRALIRDTEIITEPFSPWIEEHIEWMCTPRPDGDGYTLIEDYTPEEEDE